MHGYIFNNVKTAPARESLVWPLRNSAKRTAPFIQELDPDQDILLNRLGMGVWKFSDLEKIEDTMVKKWMAAFVSWKKIHIG